MNDEREPGDRLDSWKEIAAHMRRDVTTVQRWEKREGMPVHRHLHDKMGSVYAYRSELDVWAQSRRAVLAAEAAEIPEAPASPVVPAATVPRTEPRSRSRTWVVGAAAVAAFFLIALAVWQLQQRYGSPPNPLTNAKFVQLTDFDGIERAAALSRDGKFAAFQSDREGSMDVWVTQIGTGQFHNLTRGAAGELVNPLVRTVGFSPDGTLVTFWTRRPAGSGQSDIGIWAVPVLGGQPRPYLEAAEYDSTSDGRLVYHTSGPGDPMFVSDSGRPADARQIFSAPAGLHSHFLIWSPDGAFIYFVQGTVPDRMDIWRIKPNGEAPERLTNHNSMVSYPVFVDERTLMYLASDADGSGPWIYSLDVQTRMPRRVSFGTDRYSSLAVTSDGRRLVATLANPKGTLWRLPLTGARAEMSDARRISLTSGNGSSPRMGADYLMYVSSKGGGDSIWKLQGDAGSELWTAPDARIIGGIAIAGDGRRIAFSTRQNGQTLLYVANADGTDAHVITKSLELQSAPAWAPDARSLTVAALVDGAPRLFTVPLDGKTPARLVGEYSLDPTWSPKGDFVVFSGADIGTTFPVKAAKSDATPYALPALTLTRGARRLAFMPGGRSLVVLRGEIGHKNLWQIDLDSGAERQLTDLAPDFNVRDFDISPDGRELVLEQVSEQSDIVLLEIPPR